MASFLEVRRPEGVDLVALEGAPNSGRVTIGRSTDNDVALSSDSKASRLHAALECFPAGWCIRDLGSQNGTFVNGERIDRERPLHVGDEIRIGATNLVFRGQADEAGSTEIAERAPEVTPRERDVLLALVRPTLGGEVFAEPASTREIAHALSISEAAVKQHLLHLYDKFAIHDGDRRRTRLANEAVRRGAVSLADIRRTEH